MLVGGLTPRLPALRIPIERDVRDPVGLYFQVPVSPSAAASIAGAGLLHNTQLNLTQLSPTQCKPTQLNLTLPCLRHAVPVGHV